MRLRYYALSELLLPETLVAAVKPNSLGLDLRRTMNMERQLGTRPPQKPINGY